MDERVIISGSADETVKIWNANSGLIISTLQYHTQGITGMRFKGHTLITCSRDKSMAIWDVDVHFKLHKKYAKTDRQWWQSCIDFDEDYIIVGSSAKKDLRVLETKTGEELKVLEGHTFGVSCLCYEQDM